MQVNGHWVENVVEGDVDRLLSGDLSYRPFAWPKSEGEMILLKRMDRCMHNLVIGNCRRQFELQ